MFPPEGVRGASAWTLELDHAFTAWDLPASSTTQIDIVYPDISVDLFRPRCTRLERPNSWEMWPYLSFRVLEPWAVAATLGMRSTPPKKGELSGAGGWNIGGDIT